MKNPKIKNALIAAVIAIFSGVLLFSVNAAFGIDAPTVAPEDSGGIGPTFTDLTVTGDIEADGGIEALRGIFNGGIDSYDRVNIDGELTVLDDIATEGHMAVDEFLSVGGDIEGGGDLELNGKVIANEIQSEARQVLKINADGYHQVYVGDPVAATPSPLISSGPLYVNGGLWKTSGDVEIPYTSLWLKSGTACTGCGTAGVNLGALKIGNSSTNQLLLDDNDIISAGQDLRLNRDSGRNVTIGDTSSNSNLNVYGNTVINNDTDATSGGDGTLKVGSDFAHRIVIDKNEIMTTGDTLVINNDSDKDVQIGNASHPSSIKVYGNIDSEYNITAHDNLSVANHITSSGHITATDYISSSGPMKATRFGTTWYNNPSSWKTVTAGSADWTSIGCGAGEIIIGCQAQSSSSNSSHSGTQYIKLSEVYISTANNCVVRAKNEAASTTFYFRANAICLDPDA